MGLLRLPRELCVHRILPSRIASNKMLFFFETLESVETREYRKEG